MRYLFAGLCIGIAINLFVLFPSPGITIVPEFTTSLKNLDEIKVSPYKINKGYFVVRRGKTLWQIKPHGEILLKVSPDKELVAFSGDGTHYIAYEKVGKEIEFFSTKGDRFWKLDSREYPWISRNGEIIFLLNGDHSRIRVLNNNGNLNDAPVFAGRLCTVIAFSSENDFGGAGFLDGSYFFVNDQRTLLLKGITPVGDPVKGLALSPGGKYFMVHYGSTVADSVLLVNPSENEKAVVPLKEIHLSRSTMLVDDQGNGTVIEGDRILHFDRDGDIRFVIPIAPKGRGHGSLAMGEGFIAAGYTDTTGTGRAVVFDREGRIIFSRTCTGESFMDVTALGPNLLLRGSDNVYSYSLLRADPQ